MKKMLFLVMLCATLFITSGCGGCKHEWFAATCAAAKTCSLCGETEGEALPHTWTAATCAAAKTCSVCGATEGAPLAHTWVDATCTTAKTCSVCSTTEGTPNAHAWVDATCTTVKTCSVCNATEGTTIPHAWVDATCLAAKTCSACGATEGGLADHNYSDGKCSVCGEADPKAKQAADAAAAYAQLLLAEGYCDMFSSMIYDAWYFAIYESDDYLYLSSIVPAFSREVGISQDLVKEGINAYLKKIGYSNITDSARVAVLCTNSGALFVVDYALTQNNGFKNASGCISGAKDLIKNLDPSYASVNAYSELTSYYSAVSSYYDFCYSPNGSFSQLSSKLNTYRSNCETASNRCDIYF